MRRLAWVFSVLFLLGIVSGCGGTSSSSKAGSTESASKGSTAGTPQGGGEAKKTYTIGVLIPNLPDPFHQSVYYGIYEQAKKMGVKLVMYDAGGFANVSKQVSQMDDLLQLNVDAIILNPTSSSAMAPSVDKARGKNKPIVLYGSTVTTQFTSFIASDQKQLGEDQGKYMVEALKGKGKVVMIPGPAGVTWAVDRSKAFRDYVKANSQIQVVDEKWTDSSRQVGLSTMEDLLQANPGLDGVYTGTDYLADGAAQAAKAAGVGGKLVITTSVMAPDTQKLIEQGTIFMTSAQQSVTIGETSLKVVVDALNGVQVKATNPIPDLVVTKENVGKIDKGTINAPTGWKPPQNL